MTRIIQPDEVKVGDKVRITRTYKDVEFSHIFEVGEASLSARYLDLVSPKGVGVTLWLFQSPESVSPPTIELLDRPIPKAEPGVYRSKAVPGLIYFLTEDGKLLMVPTDRAGGVVHVASRRPPEEFHDEFERIGDLP